MTQNFSKNKCIINRLTYNLTIGLILSLPLTLICYYQIFIKNIFPNIDSAELIAINNSIYSDSKTNNWLIILKDLYFNRSYDGTINSILIFPFTILSKGNYLICFFLIKSFFISLSALLLLKTYRYFKVKTIDALLATYSITISPMIIAERSFIEYYPFICFSILSFFLFIDSKTKESFTRLSILSLALSIAFSCRPPEFLLISFLILVTSLVKKRFLNIDKYLFLGLLIIIFEVWFIISKVHYRIFYVYPNLIFVFTNIFFSYFLFSKKYPKLIILSFIFISYLIILILPFWNDTFAWMKMMAFTSTIPGRVNNLFSHREMIQVFSSRFSLIPFSILLISNSFLLKVSHMKRSQLSYLSLLAIGVIFLVSKSLESTYHCLFFIFLWAAELFYSLSLNKKIFYLFVFFLLFFNIRQLYSLDGYDDFSYKNIKLNSLLLSNHLGNQHHSKIGLVPLNEKTLLIDYGVIQLELQKIKPDILIGHIRDLDHGTGLGDNFGWEKCMNEDYDYLLIGPFYPDLNTANLSPVSLAGIDIIRRNSSNFSRFNRLELFASNNFKYNFFLAKSKIQLKSSYSSIYEFTFWGPAYSLNVPMHTRANKCNEYFDQLKKQN